MERNTLWSLRLGFSAKNAQDIKKSGIQKFLRQSFAAPYDNALPGFLADVPKTPDAVQARNKEINALDGEVRQKAVDDSNTLHGLYKGWWIGKMISSPYPLREKMACMLHNHFVVNYKKVKQHYWLHQHNAALREHAFGNLRELTKIMVRSNAMNVYLDNITNRKGKYNENLSRELLELFTLGIGNYKEADIPNGAKALAGLIPGNNESVYRPAFENTEPINYLGRKGNFKADDIVNIIFDQPSAGYLFVRKVLAWFVYDNPPEALVKYYGDYFRKQDFEIQPLLIKIFKEEFDKPTSGEKIKDPLVYILQLAHETGLQNPNPLLVQVFIAGQGMELYSQSNVKGWPGGYSWITPQLYLRRNKMADRLCKGQNFPLNSLKRYEKFTLPDYNNDAEFTTQITWKKGTSKEVISQLKEQLLFEADEALQKNFETVLKYDFDPNAPTANEGVVRLFNYMVKTPEFQLL